jgi:hypothetical protein
MSEQQQSEPTLLEIALFVQREEHRLPLIIVASPRVQFVASRRQRSRSSSANTSNFYSTSSEGKSREPATANQHATQRARCRA